MKTTLNKMVTRFILIFLIVIVLISTLTDFKAEMHVVGEGAGLRRDENDENSVTVGTVVINENGMTSSASTSNGTGTAGGINGNGGVNDINITGEANETGGINGNNGTGGINDFSALNGAYVNPLTGLNTVTDVSRNRPVAVSVSNVKAALPTNATNGISQADIVYEFLVESGITRLIALYQDFSNVGVVGSIRSTRHYMVELAEAYNAIFIHAGGSPLGFEEIENRNITNLDAVTGRRAQIFTRDPDRVPGHTVQNYHSVTTSGASYMKWVPSFGLTLTQDNNFRQALSFTSTPIPTGDSAHSAVVRFSSGKSSTFTYNEAQNLYYMSQFGSQFTDANNGNPVAFTNLLILDIPISDLVGHGEGSGRQDMSTVGSGKGYFVSGGRYVSINWSRASKSSQFVYTYENGGEIELGRGKTYIGIVPPDMNTSFS